MIGVAEGAPTIRITATDPGSISAVETFSVAVEAGRVTGRDGEWVLGATYGERESCDVYGTGSISDLTFTPMSNGSGRLSFLDEDMP